MIKPTPPLAERLALEVCRGACPTGGPCPVGAICSDCRRDSAADFLDGVGCYPGAGQPVRGGT
jgi:hypothetical protein